MGTGYTMRIEREKRGYLQFQVAHRLGVSPAALCRYEVEKWVYAKTTEIWMNIIIGAGLILLTIWGFQAVSIALREFARMNGVM